MIVDDESVGKELYTSVIKAHADVTVSGRAKISNTFATDRMRNVDTTLSLSQWLDLSLAVSGPATGTGLIAAGSGGDSCGVT